MVVLVVFALATARLTGLATLDEITRPTREAILRRLDERRASHRALAYFVTCPWCQSLWIGAAVAPIAYASVPVDYWQGANPWALVPALALAFSMTTGMLSGVGRGE